MVRRLIQGPGRDASTPGGGGAVVGPGLLPAAGSRFAWRAAVPGWHTVSTAWASTPG